MNKLLMLALTCSFSVGLWAQHPHRDHHTRIDTTRHYQLDGVTATGNQSLSMVNKRFFR